MKKKPEKINIDPMKLLKYMMLSIFYPVAFIYWYFCNKKKINYYFPVIFISCMTLLAGINYYKFYFLYDQYEVPGRMILGIILPLSLNWLFAMMFLFTRAFLSFKEKTGMFNFYMIALLVSPTYYLYIANSYEKIRAEEGIIYDIPIWTTITFSIAAFVWFLTYLILIIKHPIDDLSVLIKPSTPEL